MLSDAAARLAFPWMGSAARARCRVAHARIAPDVGAARRSVASLRAVVAHHQARSAVEHAPGGQRASGTGRGRIPLCDRSERGERSAGGAGVVVGRHGCKGANRVPGLEAQPRIRRAKKSPQALGLGATCQSRDGGPDQLTPEEEGTQRSRGDWRVVNRTPFQSTVGHRRIRPVDQTESRTKKCESTRQDTVR